MTEEERNYKLPCRAYMLALKYKVRISVVILSPCRKQIYSYLRLDNLCGTDGRNHSVAMEQSRVACGSVDLQLRLAQ